MKNDRLIRAIAAGAVAAFGLAVALWMGAPSGALLILLVAAVIVPALLGPRQDPPASIEDEPNGAPGQLSVEELIDEIDEPLLIVRDRRVLAANRAARTLLGEHIRGVDVRLALRHPAAADRLAGSGADEHSEDVEIIGLGEAGRPWLMQLREFAGGGRLVRLIDLATARAAEQMRVDFVANASHELRTPLATLLGFLETLEDEEAAGDPETRARFLGIMAGEATRMRDLVDDLLSLSHIEAERFSPPREPVDLVPLIEEVRRTLDQLLDSRKVELVVEQSRERPVVAGDRAQLAQMLTNLVVNAVKYGRGGAPVRVRFAVEDSNMLRIMVVDEGEGIAPEHLPRLTERFYRVDPGRSRQAGGTGLGLAIVKHIVLRHRGRLDIASTLGTGTTVSVYLPRADVTELSSS